MNNTAVINIRTSTAIKSQAQALAEELGLSLSGLISVLLKQAVRTQTVTLSVAKEPTNYLLKTLKESQKDIGEGFVSPTFNDVDKAVAWLNDPKQNYVS